MCFPSDPSPLINCDCADVHGQLMETLMHCVWKWTSHYSLLSSPDYKRHHHSRTLFTVCACSVQYLFIAHTRSMTSHPFLGQCRRTEEDCDTPLNQPGWNSLVTVFCHVKIKWLVRLLEPAFSSRQNVCPRIPAEFCNSWGWVSMHKAILHEQACNEASLSSLCGQKYVDPSVLFPESVFPFFWPL